MARTNKNADQMKQEVRRHRSDESVKDRTSSLDDHIRRLGFDTIGSYRTWCRRNDLGGGLHKSAAQRAKEVALRLHRTWETATDLGRELRRDLPRTFRRIASGSIRKRTLTDPVLIRLYELLQMRRERSHRDAFLQILRRADELGILIDISPVINRLGSSPGNTMLEAFLALATQRSQWRRPVASWAPLSKSRRQELQDRQLSSEVGL